MAVWGAVMTANLQAAEMASAGLLAEEREAYAACLGSAFVAAGPGGDSVGLELVDVSPIAASAGQASFSLEFLGPVAKPLGQGTHLLDHPALGQLVLFLVPVGIEGPSCRYQAIFNRLARPAPGPSAGDAGRRV